MVAIEFVRQEFHEVVSNLQKEDGVKGTHGTLRGQAKRQIDC